MLLPALGYAGILVVAGVATWKGSDLLEMSARRLSVRYGLPTLVQGSLVVAVGSSFPELATTVGSTLIHGEFELGMATIVGSAVFNILVIPGLSGLAGGGLGHDVRLVYRDALFYLTSVAVLLLAFSFALIYRPVPDAPLVGTLGRPTALVPLLLYGLYLFLQQQEVTEEGTRRTEGDSARGVRPDAGEEGTAGGEASGPVLPDVLALVGGVLLVVAGVEGLLRTAIWLGDTLGSPSFFWGATVVAAATSVPDAVISVSSARKGQAEVSLGNVLGSNIFDLLVAIPLGVLVVGSAPVDFSVAAPLVAFLTLATLLLFAFMRTDLELERWESVTLLAAYGVFLGWLGLETAGILAWVG